MGNLQSELVTMLKWFLILAIFTHESLCGVVRDKRAVGPTCSPPEGVTPDDDGEWISPDDGCSRCGCNEDGGMWCVGCPIAYTPPVEMTPPPCNPPEGATVDSDGYWAEDADWGLFCRCSGGWQLDCKLVAPPMPPSPPKLMASPMPPSPPIQMIKRAVGPTCTPPEGVTPDEDGEWISPSDGCSRCGCSDDGGMWCVGCPLVVTQPPCNPPEGAETDSDGWWKVDGGLPISCKCADYGGIECKIEPPTAPELPPPSLG